MDEYIYESLICTVSAFSIFGCLIIICFHLKSNQKDNLAQQLVYYLSLGDLIFSFSNFIYLRQQSPLQRMRCHFQAGIKLFAAQSTFFSSFFISFCIYQSIMKSRLIQTKYIGGVIFGIPLLISFIPIVLNSYGSDHYTCFFKTHSHLESILFFELQVWVVQTLNFFLCMRVMLELRLIGNNNEVNLCQSSLDLKLSKNIVKLILFYPLIQSLCWAPFTVNQLIQIFDKEIVWLSNIQFIFASSTGFFNSLVFYRTKKIQEWYRRESLCLDMTLEQQQQERRFSMNSSDSDIHSYDQ